MGRYMMRRAGIAVLGALVLSSAGLFAQEIPGEGREIPNRVSAGRGAVGGDYIVLPSGRNYVLTWEEIAIAKGEFNYENLSEVATEILPDGTEMKTISEAHQVYLHLDGQISHILKSSASFAPFLRYIEGAYYTARYIDALGNYADARPAAAPAAFTVFRAGIRFETISDGIEEIQSVDITVYNYRGESYTARYCSKPGMMWGNISSQGAFVPTGEAHELEFDIDF
jgi:hypothetical protein